MPTRDLDRLARQVKAHRLETYPSRLAAANAAGISKDTWRRVEEAEEVRDATYIKVDRALGWATGSCILIAEGGGPVLGGPAGEVSAAPEPLSVEKIRDAAFAAATRKLPAAAIGDVQAFVDELVKALRRTDGPEEGA